EGSLPLIIVIDKDANKKMRQQLNDYFFLLIIFHCSGLGHSDSEYIDISGSSVRKQLLKAFIQSGFANQSVGKYKLLPCSLGWFVNASSGVNKCIECPA
ncbi:unnamed protein product, partial [Porites evermanni]